MRQVSPSRRTPSSRRSPAPGRVSTLPPGIWAAARRSVRRCSGATPSYCLYAASSQNSQPLSLVVTCFFTPRGDVASDGAVNSAVAVQLCGNAASTTDQQSRTVAVFLGGRETAWARVCRYASSGFAFRAIHTSRHDVFYPPNDSCCVLLSCFLQHPTSDDRDNLPLCVPAVRSFVARKC